MFEKIKAWFTGWPPRTTTPEEWQAMLAEDFAEDPRTIAEDLISEVRHDTIHEVLNSPFVTKADNTPPVSTRETGTTEGATMSSIRETVTNALSSAGLSHYASHAEPVILALEFREEGIVSALQQLAQQKGLSDEETKEALIVVGLVERPTPEPEAVSAPESGDEGDSETLTLLRSIAARMDALENAAARHGVRV